MRALHDGLIVEESSKINNVTASGIILPNYGEGYKDGQMTVTKDDCVSNKAPEAKTGQVLSVGPEARLVNVGDTVIWSAYSGKEIEEDGKVYVALNINDIIAVDKVKQQMDQVIGLPYLSGYLFCKKRKGNSMMLNNLMKPGKGVPKPEKETSELNKGMQHEASEHAWLSLLRFAGT